MTRAGYANLNRNGGRVRSSESAGARPVWLRPYGLSPVRLLRSGRGATLLIVGVIVLGINMRAAITSLPPVFPELESALHLSAGTLSLLAAIPVLCFGVFSGAGAPLSRRFGEERVLGIAVVLLAAGLLLRGVSAPVLLFPGTVIAGAAIALLNVLLPSLVKRRIPERAGLVIGLYLLMLSAGAIVASAVAVPVFNAAGGGATSGSASVRIALALWAAPAVLAAVLWLPQLRYRTVPDGTAAAVPMSETALAGEARAAATRPAGVLAMGRSGLAWQVTAFMGLQSLSYYATLSWFPTMFRERGVSAVHAGDLLALMNLGNAVTCLLIPVLAHRAADQRKLAAAAMVATGVGIAGAVFGPSALAPGSIAVLGLGQGATLGLAIFYTMARAPDPASAASLSAFAQGVGYLVASTGPLTIGFLHDATGSWTLPGVVLLGVAAAQLITGWLAGRALTVPGARLRRPTPVPQE